MFRWRGRNGDRAYESELSDHLRPIVTKSKWVMRPRVQSMTRSMLSRGMLADEHVNEETRGRRIKRIPTGWSKKESKGEVDICSGDGGGMVIELMRVSWLIIWDLLWPRADESWGQECRAWHGAFYAVEGSQLSR